ncbi:Holliday junction resolvase RuvX [Candidatus Berkelbacteria bacterium CG10_big_fil_rev_8_21_14_0_10_41_12]|uniref:Putative pre-16S rRNA nuclease n=1 Tax=Candidatus Berkelbacteria bacterium CG10_big_fil_rev_8_21_14_0_10_41_12 TaxID=1974513 RepID=A0A2M6WWU6_9BACT|nr:MAG: Holliday junction resolvase RuvX [Candidatus Berkelbacteria bacterium CG10_big_fil_rev_8_21_14_0_10_41_12]
MSIIALDLGKKRVGVAVSESGKIATGLTVIDSSDEKLFLDHLGEMCKREKVQKIVIGLPLSANHRINSQTVWSREFAKKIKRALDIDIEYVDEAFSSAQAQMNIIAAGKKKNKIKDREIDVESARIILEQYLNESSR